MSEEEPVEDLDLVVRPPGFLRGRLVSPSGAGIAGARVEAVPVSDPLAPGTTAATGIDGEFELRVPPGTEEVQLLVFAPGFALRALRVPVHADDLAIPLTSLGGTLTLIPEEPTDSSSESGADPRPGSLAAPMLSVFHEGAFLAHHHLSGWAALHGESWAANAHGRGLTIPALEAGLYTACRVPLSELAALLALEEPPP